ncbi:IclR family transcriptional regulator [Arthrobacter sp. NPDC090010]|uniref:IclR family transcriptional regulator n=1 Tax=Arthrobacter sp. NPDC090010 TaxID=3363942 RepID=UPI0038025C80
MRGQGNQGVERIDRILECVARAPVPPRLTDIVNGTGLPRSTVADLVDDLRRAGYLQRSANTYRLGGRMQILTLIAKLPPPTPIDHARLEELSRIAKTPLALAALVGEEVLYLDTAGRQAPQRLRSISDDLRPRPALRTAAGRLLLTFADDKQRDHVLRAIRETDLESVEAFIREMPTIRRTRIARSDGLADPGVRALALPVYEHGSVTAAVVLLGPRLSHRSASLAQLTLEKAAAELLGTWGD